MDGRGQMYFWNLKCRWSHSEIILVYEACTFNVCICWVSTGSRVHTHIYIRVCRNWTKLVNKESPFLELLQVTYLLFRKKNLGRIFSVLLSLMDLQWYNAFYIGLLQDNIYPNNYLILSLTNTLFKFKIQFDIYSHT